MADARLPHAGQSNSTMTMDECRELKQNPEIVIPPGYEHLVEPSQYELVETTMQKWSQQVRSFMRSETGMKLAVAGKQHTVQITVKNYVPESFAPIVNLLNRENWLLAEKRPLFLNLQTGTNTLVEYFDRNPNAKRQLGLRDDEIQIPSDFLGLLAKILDKLPRWEIKMMALFKEINEDVMGDYRPHTKAIALHWIPIALIAKAIEVSIEDLTLVVLAHEVAHAYTHVGMDIGGSCWETDAFIKTDRAVTEGLAQYYTFVFLVKHAKTEREPGPLAAYRKLLEHQGPEYHTHLDWIDDHDDDDYVSPPPSEAIRLALLDGRIRGICRGDEFSANVAENKWRLRL